MDETIVSEGKYDDLLIEYAERIKKEDSILSQTSLARALREEFKLSLVEARRIVDDFCERGLLQSHFGIGSYDEWLTAELEAARRENRGVQATALAKKLNRESSKGEIGKSGSKYQKHIQNALGLADAIAIVDDYFARYGLPGVLGPHPVYGVIVNVVTEAIFCLPVLWAVHLGLNSVLGGKFTPSLPFIFFFFLAERTWKIWKKLRSPKRWAKYDAVRDRLPLGS